MRSTDSGTALAAASAAMVRGVDGASTVHVLLADCVSLLGADAAGILVRPADHALELLAATSHHALELELYQSQLRSGPCVESIDSGRTVSASGDSDILQLWPTFGRAMSAAGFSSVHASPMQWHDTVVGGLNLFWRTDTALGPDDVRLAQAFADICTLALMQDHGADDPAAMAEKLRAALAGRVVIERAKGILAHTDDLEMDEAFARLVQLSEESSQPLAQVAATILRDTTTPRP